MNAVKEVVTESQDLTIHFSEDKLYRIVEAYIVTGSDVHYTNTFDAPDKVQETELPANGCLKTARCVKTAGSLVFCTEGVERTIRPACLLYLVYGI